MIVANIFEIPFYKIAYKHWGWHVEVVPLTFGRARIIVTDGTGISDSW